MNGANATVEQRMAHLMKNYFKDRIDEMNIDGPPANPNVDLRNYIKQNVNAMAPDARRRLIEEMVNDDLIHRNFQMMDGVLRNDQVSVWDNMKKSMPNLFYMITALGNHLSANRRRVDYRDPGPIIVVRRDERTGRLIRVGQMRYQEPLQREANNRPVQVNYVRPVQVNNDRPVQANNKSLPKQLAEDFLVAATRTFLEEMQPNKEVPAKFNVSDDADEDERLQIELAMALSLSETEVKHPEASSGSEFTKAKVDKSSSFDDNDCVVIDQRVVDKYVQSSMNLNLNANIIKGKTQDKVEVECKICFTTYKEDECIMIDGCSHIFCRECVGNYLTTKINDGVTELFKCPNEGCQQDITMNIIGATVAEETKEKFDYLVFRNFINSCDNVHDCPKCQNPIECDIDVGLGECPRCEFAFCTNCFREYHGGLDCHLTDEDKQKLIQAHIRNEEEEAKLILGDAKLRHEQEYQQSDTFIKANYKKCPSCQRDVEKNGGCNHLMCSKCSAHFCWVCLEILDAWDPYVHYELGKCTTFDYPFDDDEEDDYDDDDD